MDKYDLIQWSSTNNIKSKLLLNENNIEDPNFLHAIINEDGLFILDNQIIYLDENNSFIKVGSAEEIKNKSFNGEFINDYESIGEYKKMKVENIDMNGLISQNRSSSCYQYNTSLYGNERHRNNYRKQFTRRNYRDCRTGQLHSDFPTLQYAQELWSERININGAYQNFLFFVTNLDYRSGNRWRQAGEYQDISVNLTDRSKLKSLYQNVSGQPASNPRSIVKNLTCVRGRQKILILEPPVQFSPYLDFAISLCGTVSQKVTTDIISNKWTHQVNW